MIVAVVCLFVIEKWYTFAFFIAIFFIDAII